MATSVASEKTTYAGTLNASACRLRQARRRPNNSASSACGRDFRLSGRGVCDCNRAKAVEETARPAAAALPWAAGQGPGQPQPLAGSGHADIEQPALLGDLVRGIRALNRDGGVGESDKEHGVPFQTLRRVQRRERDTLHRRGVLRGRALIEFGDQFRQVRAEASSATRSSAKLTSAASDSHRSRAAPPGGGSSGCQPRLGQDTAHGVGERRLVGFRSRRAPEQQPGLADLGPVEEPLAAAQDVWHPGLGQRLLVDL